MRAVIRRMSLGVLAALLVVGFMADPAAARPPHCDRSGVCTPASGLRWDSAPAVFDGVPAAFASIQPCPTARPDGSPLQGTLEVFVSVYFSNGAGAMTQGPVAVNPDGSWSASLTFNASGFSDPDATVTADCEDVTFTGVVVGSYKAHAISVNA